MGARRERALASALAYGLVPQTAAVWTVPDGSGFPALVQLAVEAGAKRERALAAHLASALAYGFAPQTAAFWAATDGSGFPALVQLAVEARAG
ncbi:MAG: hypothetical protein LBC27_01965 [Spirochaetaceae bacterium]|nr:hypothetical protein [Spirochaetaceae bacterium]